VLFLATTAIYRLQSRPKKTVSSPGMAYFDVAVMMVRVAFYADETSSVAFVRLRE
jgi:hypothetical protein